eukprot:m.440465 g.440465  ORF g.440465 m.440465 type:complete len:231 (-) comp20278_c8_seq1:279-971(-)
MAWRCSGATNAELVTNLTRAGIITNNAVAQAMRATDRALYCPKGTDAYEDRPQMISDEVTISAPHMHAYALEALAVALSRPGSVALDVGSGSGYLTACLARMLPHGGRAYGVECDKALVSWSRENVQRDDPALLASNRVSLVHGDGWHHDLGLGDGIDAIHVGAAAARVPENLVRQLRPGGGTMVIPVGPAGQHQDLVQVVKHANGTVTQTRLMGVSYVPLVEGTTNPEQ